MPVSDARKNNATTRSRSSREKRPAAAAPAWQQKKASCTAATSVVVSQRARAPRSSSCAAVAHSPRVARDKRRRPRVLCLFRLRTLPQLPGSLCSGADASFIIFLFFLFISLALAFFVIRGPAAAIGVLIVVSLRRYKAPLYCCRLLLCSVHTSGRYSVVFSSRPLPGETHTLAYTRTLYGLMLLLCEEGHGFDSLSWVQPHFYNG